MNIYSLAEGAQLVKAARNAIELYMRNPHFNKKIVEQSISHLNDQYGVFVTIESYPTKELRGCIGFPLAVGPISSSLVEAALGAAFEDPRFVPLSLEEYGFYSGLLLPIVPVEQKWGKEQFLEETCIKAGLPTSYWKRDDVKLYKFETQIFREEEPGGRIIEVKLEGL